MQAVGVPLGWAQTAQPATSRHPLSETKTASSGTLRHAPDMRPVPRAVMPIPMHPGWGFILFSWGHVKYPSFFLPHHLRHPHHGKGQERKLSPQPGRGARPLEGSFRSQERDSRVCPGTVTQSCDHPKGGPSYPKCLAGPGKVLSSSGLNLYLH